MLSTLARFRSLWPALALLACSASHTPTSDAGAIASDVGPLPDDSAVPSVDCHPGDPAPWSPECVTHYEGPMGGWCSDVREPPVCVGGHWGCPDGTSPGPCDCYGAPPHGCTCGRGGWTCTDAGVDPDGG